MLINLTLETQHQEYKEGKMLTGEVKQRLIEVLSEIVARHQRARAQVTEEVCNLLDPLLCYIGKDKEESQSGSGTLINTPSILEKQDV